MYKRFNIGLRGCVPIRTCILLYILVSLVTLHVHATNVIASTELLPNHPPKAACKTEIIEGKEQLNCGILETQTIYQSFKFRVRRDDGTVSTACQQAVKLEGSSFKEKCTAVSTSCSDSAELFDYLAIIYCNPILAKAALIAKIILYPILIIWYLSLLASTAESYFCPTLAILSEELNLSSAVAGITLLAFGNSAPDFFTTFAALNTHNDVAMQMGGLMGASLFCLTVVLGICIWEAARLPEYPLVLKADFYRDSITYIVGLVAITCMSCTVGITLGGAIFLILYYVGYIVIVVVINWLWPTKKKFRGVGPQRKKSLRASLRALIHHVTNFPRPELELVALEDNWSSSEEEENKGDIVSVNSSTYESDSEENFGGEQRVPAEPANNSATCAADFDESNPENFPELVGLPDPIRQTIVNDDMRIAMLTGGDVTLQMNSIVATTSNNVIDEVGLDSEDDLLLNADGGEEPKRRKKEPTLGWFNWPGEDIITNVRYIVEFPMTCMRWLSIPPCDGEWGRNRRLLVCISPPGMLILTHVQISGWDAFQQTLPNSSFPIWTLLLLVGVAIGVMFYFLTTTHRAPGDKMMVFIAIIAFLGSINWISLLGNEVVSLLTACNVTTNLSTSILGITLLAVGNSVGDLVSCVTVTRQGNMAMALGSIFGSPLFHDVAGLGVSFLITYIQGKGNAEKIAVHPQTVIAWIFLFLALVTVVVVYSMTRCRPPKWLGLWLVALYAMFIGCCIWEEMGFMNIGL